MKLICNLQCEKPCNQCLRARMEPTTRLLAFKGKMFLDKNVSIGQVHHLQACFLKPDTQHTTLKEEMISHLGLDNPSISIISLSHSLCSSMLVPQRP
jgi:hypothetical protein